MDSITEGSVSTRSWACEVLRVSVPALCLGSRPSPCDTLLGHGPLFCPALGICERQRQAASSHFLTLTLLSVLKQPVLHPTPTVETKEMGLEKAQALEHRSIGGPMLLPSKPGHLPGRLKGTRLPKKTQAELSWISGAGDELRGDLDPAGCCGGAWQLCVPGGAR